MKKPSKKDLLLAKQEYFKSIQKNIDLINMNALKFELELLKQSGNSNL